jgi:hypothetical protein
VEPIPCTSPRRDHMSWFGTRGIVLTKGYGFRNNSGSLAMFAAIRRASSRVRLALWVTDLV